LVLDPKVGLYDDFVLMLDFNSLYPSIIQEHNICFSTVERPDETEVARCGSEAELLARTTLPDGTVSEGVLPQVLRRLVDGRREVKSAMKREKDARRLQTLEIRQKALKLTANSMYGCLGFQHSRFHARPLAALITCKGREALQSTCSIVAQELQLDVVYGDTDSVFINSKTKDFEQALQVAHQIKRSVNKRYKRLEIEIDAVFAKLLLLKKKKYAGLKVTDWSCKQFERELKGLDIVRRDWCGLAKDIGEAILNKILDGTGVEEPAHWISNYLVESAAGIDNHKISLDRFVITKAITKPPQDYPDAKHQPHVQVALRLIARGKSVTSGQDIPYIITEAGDSTLSFADRARHPHEFELDSHLRVDIEWYKSQQVHPLVARILGPVEGMDAARVAECLGMDAARFAKSTPMSNRALNSAIEMPSADVTALLDRQSRWVNFESRLPGVPYATNEVASWRQLLKPPDWDENGVEALFRSPSGAAVDVKKAQNLFILQMRKFLCEYSEGWVSSGDGEFHELGQLKTRRMRRGQNMVSEQLVLRELEFLEFLCSSASQKKGEVDARGCRAAALAMHQVSKFLLEDNGYYWVDCHKVFASVLTS